MPKHSYGVPQSEQQENDFPARWTKLRAHAEQNRLWTSPSRFKVVPAGRRSGKCLAEGTLVTMASGKQKPIEKIKKGDRVLSANPMYILEPKEVLHVLSNGVKPIVEIKTSQQGLAEYRYLYCTPNHPIWTGKKWVEAGDLQKNDLVAVAKQYSVGCGRLPLSYQDVINNLKYEPVPYKSGRHPEDIKFIDAPTDIYMTLRDWKISRKNGAAKILDTITINKFNKLKKYLNESLYNFVLNGDVTWEKVLSVKQVKPAKTYDLTVKDNHNFLAEGVVTHNTELAKRKIILRCMDPWNVNIDMPLPCTLPPEQCTPDYGPRYFVAAPTWGQAKRIYWSDLKAMVPDWALPGRDRRTAIRESDMCIKFKTKAELWVIGMDKPERIEGSPWDGGILDEYGNMKARAWPEHVRPALSDRKGWCDFIGVPEGRNHYYDLAQHAKRIEQKAKELGITPEWSHFHWVSADILDKEEIASAKDFLDEMTFRQEYCADFCHFQGRAYYPFDERTHCCPLQYNKKLPLIFCFDFNINPGVAIVCQEQIMPGVLETVYDKKDNKEYSRPVIGTGVIGEVHIPQNSNTVAVCNKLVYDWGMHEGEIHIYGDATGGAGGSNAVMGSDWGLVKKVLLSHFNPDNVYFFVDQSNPRVRARINATNARLLSVSNVIRMKFDKHACPNLVRDMDGVKILTGGVDIDKSDPTLSHASDALSYYCAKRFPTDELKSSSTELLW